MSEENIVTYELEGGGVLAPSVMNLAEAPTYSDEEVLSGSAQAQGVFSAKGTGTRTAEER